MGIQDPRSHRILDCVVHLLRGNPTGERSDGDGDLLALPLDHRVDKPVGSLNRSVLSVKATERLDIVLELRRLEAGISRRLPHKVPLPVFHGIATEGHDLEGTTHAGGGSNNVRLVDQFDLFWLKIVREALECNPLDGLVDEAAGDQTVTSLEVFESRAKETLARDVDGDTGSIASDPAPAEFLGAKGGSAGTTGRVKDDIAGVGSHRYTPLYDFRSSLHRIELRCTKSANHRIIPDIRKRYARKIIGIALVADTIANRMEASLRRQPNQAFSRCLPVRIGWKRVHLTLVIERLRTACCFSLGR